MSDDPADTVPDTIPDDVSDAAPDAPRPATARTCRRVPLWVLVLIGVVAGGLVGLGASALFSGDDEDVAHLSLQDATGDQSAAQQAAKDAFLVAWRRYRTSTYSAELLFERVTPSGGRLESSSTYTQQPPRRVVRQADSVLLTAGADSRTCNRVNGAVSLRAAPDIDYAAAVDAEIATWKTALEGAVPYYVVSQPEPDCFQLDVAVEIPDPPYGEVARFCFDETTGALVKRQIVRSTATDTEEAASVTSVIPADAFTATLADAPATPPTPTTTTVAPATTTTPTTTH